MNESGAANAPLCVCGLKSRRDFVAMRAGETEGAPAFLLVARLNPQNGENVRLGFTVTKKMGSAVIRNRIRRRLRAAATEIFPIYASPGTDYVIIARRAAFDRNFAVLLDDMKRALLSLRRRLK